MFLEGVLAMVEEEKSSRSTELLKHTYGTGDIGKQANQYEKTTKAIGDYVGRVYGHEMKKLVLLGTESDPEEP